MSSPAPEPVPGPAAPEEELQVVGRPPPLLERLRGVLLDPVATFARHEPGWGWLLPWMIVSTVGMLYGLLVLGTVDIGARARAAFERQETERGSSTQAADEHYVEGEEEEEAQSAKKPQLTTQQKLQVFIQKISLVAGPPILGLVQLVLMGGLLYLSAVVLGPRGPQREVLRGVSLVAWAGLADLGGYLLRGLAVLLKNPAPQTSPAHLVDAFDAPVLAAALARLDPVLAWFYALLALGLVGSFRLKKTRAIGAAIALWLLASLPHLGIGLLAKLGQMMGGGA